MGLMLSVAVAFTVVSVGQHARHQARTAPKDSPGTTATTSGPYAATAIDNLVVSAHIAVPRARAIAILVFKSTRAAVSETEGLVRRIVAKGASQAKRETNPTRSNTESAPRGARPNRHDRSVAGAIAQV